MNIQIVSDLHLEVEAFRSKPAFTGINPACDADLVVLAGDIGRGIEGIGRFRNWPVPILYVHGNHELYGRQIDQAEEELRAACAGTRIFFMECDRIVADVLGDFPSVRFLGTTLWTHYRLFGDGRQEAAMTRCASGLNCHQMISKGERIFMPADALSLHAQSRTWLAGQVATPFDGKTVLITHHGISQKSVAFRYCDDLRSVGFSSDLEDLVAQADLWIHGHTHDSYDYRIGKCRVVVNPRRSRCVMVSAMKTVPLTHNW